MGNRNFICLLLLMATVTAYSQKNFSFSPEKPKPGDVITITYEPAGDIANTILPVEGVIYQMTGKGVKVDDIALERSAGKYSGKIMADKSAKFVFFSFFSGQKNY